jgi:hypothetical protein
MRRRNFSLIAIVGVLAMAVAGSGIATATQSGSSGADAVAAKKKKKKKKKAAVTITASITAFPPTADSTGVSGLLDSKSSSCTLNRAVQVVRVADGVVLATERTDGTNRSFSFFVQPKQPAGTQLQVKTASSKTCKPGASAILTAIP